MKTLNDSSERGASYRGGPLGRAGLYVGPTESERGQYVALSVHDAASVTLGRWKTRKRPDGSRFRVRTVRVRTCDGQRVDFDIFMEA